MIPFGLQRMLKQSRPGRLKSFWEQTQKSRPVTIKNSLPESPLRKKRRSRNKAKPSKAVLDDQINSFLKNINQVSSFSQNSNPQKARRPFGYGKSKENILRTNTSPYSSKTITNTLKYGIDHSLIERKSITYVKGQNPILQNRRNGKRHKPRDIDVAHAWCHGLLKINMNLVHTAIPTNLLSLFVKCRHNVYLVARPPNKRESRRLISFLYQTRPKILNIFGPFSSACRRGDPTIHAIILHNRIFSID